MRGRVIHGFGRGHSKDEAIFIGFMEVIERIILETSQGWTYSKKSLLSHPTKDKTELLSMFPESKSWIGNSSNGVAIHSNKEAARENALNELIERHVVLKSLLLRIHPIKLKDPRYTKGWHL